MRRIFLAIPLLICMACFLSSCAVSHVAKPSITPQGYETRFYDTSNFSPDMRQGLYHSVAPGETLWRISEMYDVEVDAIKKANRIKDIRDLDLGLKLYIPNAAPRKDIITLYPTRKWQYIIIHHSATETGSSREFNKIHLRKGWQSVGYHFVIDNGTSGKDDGQIEATPRWINQLNGAHCKVSRMNERGIGICLVGNFSKDRVTAKQINALVYLVKLLQSYYKIPAKKVLGHGQVRRAKTECPGKKFPWKEFRIKVR